MDLKEIGAIIGIIGTVITINHYFSNDWEIDDEEYEVIRNASTV